MCSTKAEFIQSPCCVMWVPQIQIQTQIEAAFLQSSQVYSEDAGVTLRTPGQARDYNTVRIFPPYSYSVSLPKYRLPLSHSTFHVVRNVLHVALELGIVQLEPQERQMSVPILASEEGNPGFPTLSGAVGSCENWQL